MPIDYDLRPLTLDDAGRLGDMWRDYAAEVGMDQPADAELMRHRLDTPGADLSRDSIAVVIDEEIQAYTIFRHAGEARLWGHVAAPFRRAGLGTMLIAWGVGRAKTELGLDKVFIGTSALRFDAHSLYLAFGFTFARTFHTMRHGAPGTVVAPAWPHGVTWRHGLSLDESVATAVAVHNRAFVDHWEHRPTTAFAMEHTIAERGAGPELSLFAYTEGEPVALCVCKVDGDLGFVNILGTDPRARGRGIGLAILGQAIVELAARGATRVELEVDADNPTGAVQLYRRAGMTATSAFSIFELAIDP